MDYACTALTVLENHKDMDLKWLSLCYARRSDDSACICNNKLPPCCNIVSVEQCILALGDN